MDKPELTPEQKAYIKQKAYIDRMLQDVDDMIESVGAHTGHTRQQIGRCIYCSCGKRVQGWLPKKKR